MSLLRVLYLLAGLAVAAALLLGAVCDWGQRSAVVAALGPGDALFGVLGLVLAVMTGAAGVLMAVDVRADMAAAQAWHEIYTEAVVFATLAETTPMGVGDVLYATRAQDDSLPRIWWRTASWCRCRRRTALARLRQSAATHAPLFNPLAPPSSPSFKLFGQSLLPIAPENHWLRLMRHNASSVLG